MYLYLALRRRRHRAQQRPDADAWRPRRWHNKTVVMQTEGRSLMTCWLCGYGAANGDGAGCLIWGLPETRTISARQLQVRSAVFLTAGSVIGITIP